MTATRRTLVLLAALVAVVLGTTPAMAAFSGKSPALAATVGTVEVAAPTDLRTGGTRCWTTTYTVSYNGVTTTRASTTMRAKLSWQASSTPRVTSYVITAYLGGGKMEVTEVPASITSVTENVDGDYADANIRVTVTAKTDYGWTAESQKSGIITC
ncbi:hypothetical protein [Modestobacter lapidis]|nr:hypothetical protein [Modestobacter lapidis]